MLTAEEQLRAIISATPECIKIVSAHGELIDMNEAGLQMLDAAALELVQGREIAQFIMPEDRARWIKNHQHVCSGHRVKWEFGVITLSGKLKRLESNAVPIRLADGTTAQLAVTRDVTARRQTEIRLRKSERMLSQTLTVSALGTFQRDPHLNAFEPSLALRKMLGFSADSRVSFEDYLNLVHPDDKARFMQATHISKVAEGHSGRSVEHRIILPNGETRWLSLRHEVLPESSGSSERLLAIGTVRDITADRLAMRHLKESEQRWRSLFASMQEGFAICRLEFDADGRVTTALNVIGNAEWEKITGLSDGESIGTRSKEILGELEASFSRKWKEILSTGATANFEKYIPSMDRWFEFRASKHAYNEIAISFLDITSRKIAELEAADANERLLSVSRLSAMGAMASTIAHELNQPLGTAMNYLSIIQRELEKSPVSSNKFASALEGALNAFHRSGQIIRRMRNFTVRGRIDKRAEDFRDIIERAVLALREVPDSQDIEIIQDCIDQPLIIEVDRLQIEQVLTNLLQNAAHALAGQKDKKIRVSIKEISEALKIAIEDNGPGLPPQSENSSSFPPFVTTKSGGMGLGLSLCQTILEAHSGKLIATRSSLGGAAFVIELPLSEI